ALLVWLLGSVLALLGALTFGELGAMLPDAGGSYVYVREAFGSLPAFLLGWTLFLAINTGSTATLAVAFANYLGELVPLTPLTHKLAGFAMIAAVTAVNVRGVRQAASLQNWSTALKVSAIVALALPGFALGDGLHRPDTRVFATRLAPASLSAAGVALLGVLWAYEGWQNVTNSAGEAADPQHTFARGIGLGTAALVVIDLTADAGSVAAVGALGAAADVRGARGGERVRAAPPPPRRTAAVSSARLPGHAGAVYRCGGGDRGKHDRRAAGAGARRPRDRGDRGAGVLGVETGRERHASELATGRVPDV